jgi:DNA-binding response OmpR family regulator
MPARIVVVHQNGPFLTALTRALIADGYDVALFTDPDAAHAALELAQRVEVLVTQMDFGGQQMLGLSLARVTRAARPDTKVLFLGKPQFSGIIKEVGEFMDARASPSRVAHHVASMLDREG